MTEITENIVDENDQPRFLAKCCECKKMTVFSEEPTEEEGFSRHPKGHFLHFCKDCRDEMYPNLSSYKGKRKKKKWKF